MNSRPGRVCRRHGQHRTPDARGVSGAAILLGRHAEEIARLDVFAIESDGAFEGRFGLPGDDIIGGGDERLTETFHPIGSFAVQCKRLAPRIHRILETTEPR